MEQTYKAEMQRNIEMLLSEKKLSNKSVLVFGHGNGSEAMIDYLAKFGVRTVAILDNNDSKLGQTYQMATTLSPTAIKGYTSENSIVLIASRFFDAMSMQLRRLGYNGEVVKVVDYNSFSEYSLSEETVVRKKARVLRGITTLGKIRTSCQDSHLVICPYNALGDVYWAMAFLPAYLAKHGLQQASVVVTGSGCRQVVEMFGVNQVTELERVEMDELVQAIIYTREGNCIIAHHDRPYTDNIIKYLDKRFLSFVDYYRYAVYGLSKDAPPIPPSIIHEFENKERLVQDKSLILAPYAKSVTQIPDSYWEAVASEYQNKGYFVYTNISGEENAIRGTRPLSVPLTQIISAVEYAGYFIGIRSGLCDIVHTAKCSKKIVFPNGTYSTTPFKVKDFFALSGWEHYTLGPQP
ncbi:hypothetical protein COLU111180_03145 [Cohnella lubricantis]|uniref:Uncharacterized protein n=1 Tax=Cohnella lubricantis TaxID=2163172 RepID=A0A841TDH6_9BACL|nr:hypothetical protein [Cohnella lubricantis]MBB6677388.1 hypothetical protein [Cohnella lubricantis]MBP2118721.1 hypothetical protein [Cohnella lubricantis]